MVSHVSELANRVLTVNTVKTPTAGRPSTHSDGDRNFCTLQDQKTAYLANYTDELTVITVAHLGQLSLWSCRTP